MTEIAHWFTLFQEDNCDAVTILVAGGADTNILNAKGTPILVSAVKGNRVDILETLLGSKGRGGVGKYGQEALSVGLRLRSVPCVTLLLQNGVVVGPLSRSQKQGLRADCPQMLELLEGRSTAVERAETEILTNWKAGNLPAVSTVIRNMGVEFCLDTAKVAPHLGGGFTPALHWLLEQGHQVAIFMQQPSDFLVATPDGETLLHRAAALDLDDFIKAAARFEADFGVSTPQHGSPLHAGVVGSASCELIELLARKAPNVDLLDRHGRTALHLAALKGRGAIVDTLLRAGASPDVLSAHGYPPVAMAARSGACLAVKSLIDAGADLHQRIGSEGDNILHEAVRGGDFDTVMMLIDAGAQVRAVNHRGLLPIHIAAAADNLRLVRAFLAVDDTLVAATDRHGKTPTHLAAGAEGGKVLRYFLELGVDADAVYTKPSQHRHMKSVSKSAVNLAAKLSDVRNLELLRRHGADLSGDNDAVVAPTVSAAKSAGRITYNYLDAERASENGFDLEAFLKALAAENVRLACDIVASSNPVQLAAKGPEALAHAAAFGRARVTYALLERGIDPNTTAPGHDSAIVYAVREGHLADTRHLASFGASLDTSDSDGCPLLHLAVRRNEPAMALLLLALGGPAQRTKHKGGSVIAVAANNNKLAMALALAAYGYDIDASADDTMAWHAFVAEYGPAQIEGRKARDTVLHMATRLGAPDYVIESIAIHQGVNALNKMGMTALHLAKSKDAIRALIARGARLHMVQNGSLPPSQIDGGLNELDVFRRLLGLENGKALLKRDGADLLKQSLTKGRYDIFQLVVEVVGRSKEEFASWKACVASSDFDGVIASTLQGGAPVTWNKTSVHAISVQASEAGLRMLELLEKGFDYPGTDEVVDCVHRGRNSNGPEVNGLVDGSILPVTSFVGAYSDAPAGQNLQVLVRGNGADKWVFDGVMSSELPQHGLLMESTGLFYDGMFKEGRKHGLGYQQYPHDAFYDGEFTDGEASGLGIFGTSTGEALFGQFVRGRAHGLAIRLDGPGANRYQRYNRGRVDPTSDEPVPVWGQRLKVSDEGFYMGPLEQNLPHGVGILRYPNGDRYYGDFALGSATGVGVLSYTDGSRYSGDVKLGVAHGVGIQSQPDGIRYEGNFLEGQTEGPGVQVTAEGQQLWGPRKKGMLNGFGWCLSPDRRATGAYFRDNRMIFQTEASAGQLTWAWEAA